MKLGAAVASLVCLAGPACGSVRGAEAFVTSISPPAVTRGQTTRLTLSGTDLADASGLWTSLPAGVVTASIAARGEGRSVAIDVRVAPGAPVGLYGLRLATAHGLSNPHLFVIDDLPVVPAEAVRRALSLPVAVAGTFREAAADRFAFAVQAGERLTFEAVANRFGKDADPLVTVRDPRGRVVAERDNDGGLWFDCRFAHTFAAAGVHTVEVRDSRYEGGEGRGYLLRIGRFPEGRTAIPAAVRCGRAVEVRLAGALAEATPLTVGPVFDEDGLYGECRRAGDDSSAWVLLKTTDLAATPEVEAGDDAPTPARLPTFLCGRLARPGESDTFGLELAKGQAITVKGVAREVGSPADLELILCDPAGNEVQRVDDVLLDDAAFAFTAGVEGAYRLRVRDATGGGGPNYAYGVEVRDDLPRFEVASDVAALTVPRGGRQPIPLTVTRSNYAGPIALALEGRPPGLSLRPDVVPAGVTQFVTFLEAAESCPEGLGTLRIEADAGRGALAVRARTHPLVDRQAVNVDLLKTALREDQRCLPPSLNDRIALLVGPPAPFSFDLPEQAIDLARFQHAEFPIEVRREPSFTAPVTFRARGGPIGDKAELRVQVYAEIPAATPGADRPTGVLRSRNLAQTADTLVSIDATAPHRGRLVTLTRTFRLDLKPAFALAVEPARLALKPGATARFKLKALRLRTFDGPVTVVPPVNPGVVLPATIEVPAGRAEVEVEVTVRPGTGPGALQVGLPARARVSGYEEEVRGPELTIEVEKR